MRVSFWLIPAEPDRTALTARIDGLAERFNGPKFLPHVTLYSGPLSSADDPGALLDEVARRARPLKLKCTGIGHSGVFTKTLFLEFAPNEELRELSAAFQRGCQQPAGYELRPHLSLLYANIPEPERHALAAGLPVPEWIAFDILDAIVSQDQIHTRSDVEGWQRVGERPLPRSSSPWR